MRQHFLRYAALIAVLAAVGGARAAEPTHKELYDMCVKSCVFIMHAKEVKGGVAFSMGSGSLIDVSQRLVLTNYHVVDEEKVVAVFFPIYLKNGTMVTEKEVYIEKFLKLKGGFQTGKVLHKDKNRDLAVLRLNGVPAGTKAVQLAKESTNVGESVFNIGNPGAVNHAFSTTKGDVRAVGQEDLVVVATDGALSVKCKMITATNPVNPGDSGGPLFDRRGIQVGVTESTGGGRAQKVNRFVDIEEVWAFLKEKKITLKDQGEPGGGSDSTLTSGKEPKDGDVSAKPKAVAGQPTEADEKAAAAMLSRANNFKNNGSDEEYLKILKEIVKKYPATKAGKDAKRSLGTKN